ncbi:biotin transport system substrate-specific component [Flavimobilis soli]|uniref:Biotin transporter n=1 Tax=Flavimobilis soli TaxID=442709 RepID=A0A2A9EAW5_9MICO|nr:biotin transporter BioY [Flavimobilis soli]PFG35796.1 biotin transport system substrate-specific component [Flavimobilis soli]
MPSSTVGPADAPAASRSVAGTSLAPRARSASTETALVATFAALLAVCSLLALSFGAVPVPVTLQTFAVLLAGAVLGPRLGPLAVLLHLVVGLVGLPVLAGAKGGLAVLAGPSAGYLLAFPLAALVTGVIVVALRRRGAALVAVTLLAGIAGTLVIYAVGVPVMAWRAGMSLEAAVAFNNLFVPFDLVKVALVAITAPAVHRAFPDLLPTRRRREAA